MNKEGCTIKVLFSDVVSWVQAKAGTYIQYTGDNSETVTTARMSLNSAQAMLTGPDHKFELMAFTDGMEPLKQFSHDKCTMTFNQALITESWSMTAQVPIEIKVTFD